MADQAVAPTNTERARAWFAAYAPYLKLYAPDTERGDPREALTALLDAVAAEAEARGRAAAEMAVRFARIEEREACARECEEIRKRYGLSGSAAWGASECAASIRRRGEGGA